MKGLEPRLVNCFLFQVNKNFPIFVKNLTSVVELAINYTTTLVNVFLVYVGYAIDFVGMQLLG